MYFFTEHDLAHIALLRRRWWFYYVTELTRLAAVESLRAGQDGDCQLRPYSVNRAMLRKTTESMLRTIATAMSARSLIHSYRLNLEEQDIHRTDR